jgi:hypothetical protein
MMWLELPSSEVGEQESLGTLNFGSEISLLVEAVSMTLCCTLVHYDNEIGFLSIPDYLKKFDWDKIR